MTKFIGIISAKGGVGKTTTTINLAGALHFFQRNVIALDANFANPDLGIHLGMHKTERSLHTAMRGRHSIRDTVYRHPSGLRIIPGSIAYSEARRVERKNLLTTIYDLAGTAEAVIIDSTPGLSGDARTVVLASDYLLIVTTPDLVSVTGSLKMVKLAEEHRKQVLGIVVNKQREEGYEMSTENIAEFLGKRVIGVIPDDPLVRRSLHAQKPLVLTEPNAGSSIGFKKMAGILIGRKYREKLARRDSSFSAILRRVYGGG